MSELAGLTGPFVTRMHLFEDFVSKLFERAIYDQLYIYFSSNNLLTKHQSGFRSLHSTATALLEATNEWYFNVDQGNINLVVFL